MHKDVQDSWMEQMGRLPLSGVILFRVLYLHGVVRLVVKEV